MICSLIGCYRGGSPAGFIEVSGIVTAHGKPLKTGVVSFVPVGDGGSTAAGAIDADGQYTLSTSSTQKGISPGIYKVRIESWSTPPSMDGPPAVLAIPKKFYEVKTSGLEAVVELQPERQQLNFILDE